MCSESNESESGEVSLKFFFVSVAIVFLALFLLLVASPKAVTKETTGIDLEPTSTAPGTKKPYCNTPIFGSE